MEKLKIKVPVQSKMDVTIVTSLLQCVNDGRHWSQTLTACKDINVSVNKVNSSHDRETFSALRQWRRAHPVSTMSHILVCCIKKYIRQKNIKDFCLQNTGGDLHFVYMYYVPSANCPLLLVWLSELESVHQLLI